MLKILFLKSSYIKNVKDIELVGTSVTDVIIIQNGFLLSYICSSIELPLCPVPTLLPDLALFSPNVIVSPSYRVTHGLSPQKSCSKELRLPAAERAGGAIPLLSSASSLPASQRRRLHCHRRRQVKKTPQLLR